MYANIQPCNMCMYTHKQYTHTHTHIHTNKTHNTGARKINHWVGDQEEMSTDGINTSAHTTQ